MPKISRRTLLKSSTKVGLTLPFLGCGLLSCQQRESSDQASTVPESPPKLNILILGGTSFLGPHQVAYALGRGHQVTIFTRGKTQPTVHQELFEQVTALVGDRENDLQALEEGSWDVIIDNSGRKTEWVQQSAALLKDRADLYLYTSSTGVYYPYLGEQISESTPVLLELPEEMTEEEELEYGYGVMKATSEQEVRKAFGEDRSIIVRPTYMVGPADKLDRFIHWPIRLARGGDVLVPGRTTDPVQYVDVRDVAEFMIRLAEQKQTGTYNAVGPKATQTMPEFVAEAQQAFPVESTLVQIEDYEFLTENEVYYIVPWIPSEGNNYGSARVSNKKAIAAGLTFRPLAQTVKDTHDWWYSDALTDERRARYEEDPKTVLAREAKILEAWRVKQG